MLKFKELREKYNYTQKDFAEKISISPRSLSSYEKGNIDISLKKLQEIAEILKVSIFDLFIEPQSKNTNILNEPAPGYELKNNGELLAQKKTIEILEREVEDLRDDKHFLKQVIENKLGNAKTG